MLQYFMAFAAAGTAVFVVATLLAGILGRIGFPVPGDERRLGCIDGLRGYLALAVLLHHFALWVAVTRLGSVWRAPPQHVLNQLGAGAVGLFFMTTGLVFYPRILTGLRATPWTGVYVTRVFRIVPLVVVATAIITVIVMVRTGARPDAHYIVEAAEWITTYRQVPILGYAETGQINAHVLWSLWYEWLFYLLVLPASALAMDIVRARGLPTWTVPAGLLAAGVIARVAGMALGIFPGILFYLPLFACGMLAYELRAREGIRQALAQPRTAVVAVAALAVGMVTTSNPYSLSLPLFAFFFACVACGNSLGGALRLRGALVLGECSFGIYLLHGIVLNLLFVSGGGLHADWSLAMLPLLLPIAAVIVVLVTATTFLLIERPFMRAGRTLARWLAGRRERLAGAEVGVAP